MRLEIPEQKILVHEISLPIMWGDMDQLGHVNNTVYFKYMEHVRVSWIEAMTGAVADDTQGAVIANAFFNFYQPLVFPGNLVVRLYVASPGRTSLDTYVSIERADRPGEVYAAGGATMVWISTKDGRPAPLPEPMRALSSQPPSLPGHDPKKALPQA